MTNVTPGVYKFRCDGKLYYRLGLEPEAIKYKLARELKVDPSKIEILDGGRKQ